MTSGAFDIPRTANTLRNAWFGDAQAEAQVTAKGGGHLAVRLDIIALSDPVRSDIAAPEQRMRPEMKDLESRLNRGSGDYLRRRRARG